VAAQVADEALNASDTGGDLIKTEKAKGGKK
jgi:hypothetical protein